VLNINGIHDIRKMDIHTAEILVPEPSLLHIEIAIGNLKSYKSPGTDQIQVELINEEGETLCSEVHKFISTLWDKGELYSSGKEILFYQFIEGVIDCYNYGGISLLSNAHKILSNIILANLAPYAKEIFVNHQFDFHRNRSTTYQIFHV